MFNPFSLLTKLTAIYQKQYFSELAVWMFFKKDTRILTVYNTLVQSGFSFGEYDVKGQYGDESFTKMIIKKENYADGATWIYFYFINDEKEVARYFFTYLGSNIWFNEFLQKDLVIEK